jgi:hypothetical protein
MEIQESTNRFLNLVYDTWEGDSFRYNLSDYIGNDGFNDPAGFFDFYSRYFNEQFSTQEFKIPIKRCNLEDVYNNPDKIFYYGIKTDKSLHHLFDDIQIQFSDKVIKCFRDCSNIIFLYIREHESETIYDFNALKEFIKINKLKENQFLILSNNPNIENYIKDTNSNLSFRKINLLKLTSTSVLSEVETRYNSDKEGKFFSCFNKNPKNHRYVLLSLLNHIGVINDTNYSFLGTANTPNIEVYKNYITDEYISKVDFDYIYNIGIKESDYEEGLGYFNEDLSVNTETFPSINGGGGASGGLMLPEFIQTFENNYLNIVTESMFEDSEQTIHITEKSFRPFYFYMFPMILSTFGHIQYMKDNYGFDFYDDIIDHSYDLEPNQKKRMKLFIEEIFRIYNNKDFFIDFYKNNKQRFENNKKIVESLCNDTSDYDFFKKLIK